MNSQEGNKPVKETVIQCVKAPGLKGVSTRHLIEFKRQKKLYEKQIKENARQLKLEKMPTSYKTCIEDDHLKIFIVAGWVGALSIDVLTESQILDCIEERCKKEVNGEPLFLLDL